MVYKTGSRLLDRQFDLAASYPVDCGPLTVGSTGAHVDPHLVVLGTLLAFWGVYVGLRIRDVIATAV